MGLNNGILGWVIPILIGIVASVLLLAIIYDNPFIISKFADLGAIIQLQTSRPAYNLVWQPISHYSNSDIAKGNSNSNTNINITSVNSPLYNGTKYPIYNYYPQTPLNPIK
jgi:hypothetical protein